MSNFRNRIQCTVCKEIIESKHEKHFVSCYCKTVFIDGGIECRSVGGDSTCIFYMPFDDSERNKEFTQGKLEIKR